VPTLAVSVLTATVIVAVDWTYSFVHGYYRLNRNARKISVAAGRAAADEGARGGLVLPRRVIVITW
jgi:hypothetical protein